MKQRPMADGHVKASTALDYLDGVLGAEQQREVEAHLARPCPTCRERMRALGALLHRMRLDRVPPVPEELHARALAVFTPAEPASMPERAAELMARLLFDSWTEPLPAAARRSVGEAHRLRFALGLGAIELECETESPGLVTLRGRLETEDAPLHRIQVTMGAEVRAAWPDAGGAFALEHLPAGVAHLQVEGPTKRFRIPPITL